MAAHAKKWLGKFGSSSKKDAPKSKAPASPRETSSSSHSSSHGASPLGSSSGSSSSTSVATLHDTPASPSKAVETYVRRGWVVSGPFGEEDSEENLLFEEETSNNLPQIRGATLPKLVERVTFDKYPDPDYMHQFLLTYRSFTNPTELLSLLKERFQQPPPSNLKPTELGDYKTKIERNIRLRVFNFCKAWVSKHWYDFASDPELKANFLEWLNTGLREEFPAAPQLEKILEREIAKAEAVSRALASEAAPSSEEGGEVAPRPILPPTKARALTLLDFHPLEFARQMTILEFEIYCKIKPWEFLGLAWAKPKAAQRAPHILDMIQWTNRITAFVASEILRARGAMGKIKTINFFIKVLQHLYELHNFSAISAISAGFQHAAVHRLRPYWGEISRSKMTAMETITGVCSTDHNSAALRAELKQTAPPLIPYLGMYLTDLTFLDEGNPDLITLPSGKKLVNFSKKRRISLIIRDIQGYQFTPYVLTPVRVIQAYIKGAQTYDDDTLYKISEQTIPKGQNKLTLRELEAAEKTQGAGRQEQLDKEIEAIIGQAAENLNFGELEEVPGYPFYDPDIPNENIILQEQDGQEVVVAGTIAKLVERLTYTQRPDARYMEAFILTWSSLTTPEQLFEYLRFRFDVPMPIKGNLDTRTKYKQLVVSPTQLRVCNAMKVWLEKCNKDFLVFPSLPTLALGLMEHIAESNPILTATSQRIIEALRQLADGQEPTGRTNLYEFKDADLRFGADGDSGIEGEEYPFCVSARDFAREIFAADQSVVLELHRPAPLIDYLDNPSKYPRLQSYIMWPRTLCRWVTSSILTGDTVERRVGRIQYFMQLLLELRHLRDYHSFVGVQQGLSDHSIMRLEVAFSRIESNNLSNLPSLKDLRIELQNYESQRELLKKEGYTSPVIPFFPCFLSELSNANREPRTLPNGLLNFNRARLLASKISEIIACQSMTCPLPLSERYSEWAAAVESSSLSDAGIEERVRELEPQESMKLVEEQAARESVIALGLSVRTALQEDPSLREALSRLFTEADSEYEQSVAELKVNMSVELQQLGARFLAGSDEFESAAREALVVKFGEQSAATLKEWSHPDQGGLVYGWSEHISLATLTHEDHTILVFLQPSLNASALGSIIRKKNFYQTCTRTTGAIPYVLSCQATAQILAIAQQNDIDVEILQFESY